MANLAGAFIDASLDYSLDNTLVDVVEDKSDWTTRNGPKGVEIGSRKKKEIIAPGVRIFFFVSLSGRLATRQPTDGRSIANAGLVHRLISGRHTAVGDSALWYGLKRTKPSFNLCPSASTGQT
jgi:hypothetical protein